MKRLETYDLLLLLCCVYIINAGLINCRLFLPVLCESLVMFLNTSYSLTFLKHSATKKGFKQHKIFMFCYQT